MQLYKDYPPFIEFLEKNHNPEVIYFCPLCGGYSTIEDGAHFGTDIDCLGEPNLQKTWYIMDIPVYT